MDHPPFCVTVFCQTVCQLSFTVTTAGRMRHSCAYGVASHLCARLRVTGRLGDSYNVRETLRGGKYGQTGVNWRKIKAEYIAGGISQRKLADKYGVSASNLMRRANREGWNKRREAAESKAIAKTVQRTAEKTAELASDNAVLLERVKTGLLKRLVCMVEEYPDTNVAELRRKQNGALMIYRMKDIAAVYAALEDKTAKGQSADIEDLSPLAELLRDE